MQELEELKREVAVLEKSGQELDELGELWGIAESDSDRSEIEAKVGELEKELAGLEFKTLLDGRYDRNSAIISIHAGAGGVDAQDWAEMLLRMYLRWAEREGFKSKIHDESRGQEAGIKSATLEIDGPYAYGYLKGESGVHRLVRLSPFNSDNLRQTSFAMAEVMPVIDSDKSAIEIRPDEVRVDVYRSQGAGGQGVNTTDSAVRITHLPTGIMVTCQNERSQLQNKAQAMRILESKLLKKRLEEEEAERKRLRGEPVSAEWGSQIRSYVLHPYQMVKDHRTKYETSDTEGVLGGDIRGFIDAYLESLKK